jgi:hypothetical protein
VHRQPSELHDTVAEAVDEMRLAHPQREIVHLSRRVAAAGRVSATNRFSR